jgi:drug/metabolite transporter (DMT)-like permease
VIHSAIWLPAAILAGLFQAWRTAIQQKLRNQLSVSGAGLVRYLYGAPVAILLAGVYLGLNHTTLPPLGLTFFAFAAAGGLAQILGTNLLIMAFGYRNFVVGTAFSKTEAVQAALFAWLMLGEALSPLVWAGIAAGVVGVLLLALGGRKIRLSELFASLSQPAALCGLSAGSLFAITGILVKRATQQLGLHDTIAAALITLVVVLVLQSLMHGTYVALREPATLPRIVSTWRSSAQVGLLAALGSACWFSGFASAPVALVRIVGQVEVIFTLAFAALYLREKTRPHEAAGLLLVASGVVLALLGARGV